MEPPGYSNHPLFQKIHNFLLFSKIQEISAESWRSYFLGWNCCYTTSILSVNFFIKFRYETFCVSEANIKYQQQSLEKQFGRTILILIGWLKGKILHNTKNNPRKVSRREDTRKLVNSKYLERKFKYCIGHTRDMDFSLAPPWFLTNFQFQKLIVNIHCQFPNSTFENLEKN